MTERSKETIHRNALMPWIIRSLDDMGNVDISDVQFELDLIDQGPDESKLGADLKFIGPEVVTQFFVAAALFISEDQGNSFLDALDNMQHIADDTPLDKLREGDVSMKLIVDFSDINNPTVQSENLSAEGFLVTFVYLAQQYGEEMGEKVCDIIMNIAQRLMTLHDKLTLVDHKEEEAK